MESLPREVRGIIISYLDMYDVRVYRLVCRAWLGHIDRGKFIHDYLVYRYKERKECCDFHKARKYVRMEHIPMIDFLIAQDTEDQSRYDVLCWALRLNKTEIIDKYLTPELDVEKLRYFVVAKIGEGRFASVNLQTLYKFLCIGPMIPAVSLKSIRKYYPLEIYEACKKNYYENKELLDLETCEPFSE